jgi:hypothetical protein
MGPEAKTTGGGEERETAGGAEVKHNSIIFRENSSTLKKVLKYFANYSKSIKEESPAT